MLSPNFLNAFARTFQCYYPIICPDLPFDMLCFALRYARVKSCYAIEFFTLHSSFFTYFLFVLHLFPSRSSLPFSSFFIFLHPSLFTLPIKLMFKKT